MKIVSRSQAGQDVFAFSASGEKLNGTFLDIGCQEPVANSNTFALEEMGWTGLRVDIVDWSLGRKSPFIIADATKHNPAISHFAKQHGRRIDYLSLDCDEDTVAAMFALPFSEFQFGAITIEHDKYRLGPGPQKAIRDFLIPMGYRLIRADVPAPPPWSGPFEDWFVLPMKPIV